MDQKIRSRLDVLANIMAIAEQHDLPKLKQETEDEVKRQKEEYREFSNTYIKVLAKIFSLVILTITAQESLPRRQPDPKTLASLQRQDN